MKYPARFPIAEPSRFRLGGSQDNVAVPFPCDDRLDGVGARRVHAHRIKRPAMMQIVTRVATVRRVGLMRVCSGSERNLGGPSHTSVVFSPYHVVIVNRHTIDVRNKTVEPWWSTFAMGGRGLARVDLKYIKISPGVLFNNHGRPISSPSLTCQKMATMLSDSAMCSVE